MKKSSRRLTFCLCLILLNLTFIWGNSLLNAELSGALSRAVQKWLGSVLSHPSVGSAGSGLLRKAAHFTEFLFLGIWLGWLWVMITGRPGTALAPAFFSGVAAAAADEAIQFFVPGRFCSIIDVGIDTSGVIAGLSFLYICQLMSKNFTQKQEETT